MCSFNPLAPRRYKVKLQIYQNILSLLLMLKRSTSGDVTSNKCIFGLVTLYSIPCRGRMLHEINITTVLKCMNENSVVAIVLNRISLTADGQPAQYRRYITPLIQKVLDVAILTLYWISMT